MGRFLFIFLSLSMFSFTAVGQFYVGVQGGSNLSKMDFTNNQEYRFREINYAQGFIGGVVAQYLGEKHAGVQFELNYSQRGWVEMDTAGVNNLKIKDKMDYVELPMLTHVNIGGGRIRGILNLGPYLGYALNRQITTTDLNTGSEQTEDYVFDNDRDNRIDFGLLAGGGFEYRFGRSKIAAEARYTIGLGDINKIKVQKSELSQFRIVSILLRYTIALGSVDSPSASP